MSPPPATAIRTSTSTIPISSVPPYDPMIAYGRSKTANIRVAVEFDRRHKARGVRATALHPGGIMTELGRHLQPGELEATVVRINAQLATEGRPPFQFKTIPQGAP